MRLVLLLLWAWVLKQEGRIFTGPNERTELKLPLASVRVGSNVDFRFARKSNEMSLNSGTILLSARDSVVLYVGTVTVKTSRGDLLVSVVPGIRIKVIVLDGKVRVESGAKRRNLRFGEVAEITKGRFDVDVIDLDKLIETSLLLRMGPLQNQWRLNRNVHRQIPYWPPIAASPEGYKVSRETSTAGMMGNIAAQGAMQVAANEQILVDRRVQRLVDQGLTVSQAERQLGLSQGAAGASQAGGPQRPTRPTRPMRPPRFPNRPPGGFFPNRPPGGFFPNRPGVGLPGGPIGPPLIPP